MKKINIVLKIFEKKKDATLWKIMLVKMLYQGQPLLNYRKIRFQNVGNGKFDSCNLWVHILTSKYY